MPEVKVTKSAIIFYCYCLNLYVYEQDVKPAMTKEEEERKKQEEEKKRRKELSEEEKQVKKCYTKSVICFHVIKLI